jgi:hypothetical protein
MMKYLVICGILLKNNCDAFCNAFPKTELSPAREENTLLTHHNQLSLSNKQHGDSIVLISNSMQTLPRLTATRPRLTKITLLMRPLRPMWPSRLMRPLKLMPTRPTRQIRLMWLRMRPTRRI